MTTTTILDLYRSPVNVWVEDDMTRIVLTDLWQDAQLHVLSGGGVEEVRTMVRAADGLRTLRNLVVGVLDRDFEADNTERWEHGDTRMFVLPAHEIENLLLDFEVLASLSGQPATTIRAQAHAYAVSRQWWVVGKTALRELRRDHSSDFPSDPPEDLDDSAAVEKWFSEQRYWTTHREHWSTWCEARYRRARIHALGDDLARILAADEWVTRFPGKEILRHLRANVRGLDKTPPRPPKPSSADRDLNLAKSITRTMRERKSIPEPLARLRVLLRTRAGLSA